MKSKEVLELLQITRPTLTKYVKEGIIKTNTLPNEGSDNMQSRDKCKDFQSDTKEDLELQINKWIKENDTKIEILSKKYRIITTDEVDVSNNSNTDSEIVYKCNIRYAEIHPKLLYNIKFSIGEFLMDSYHNVANMTFIDVIDSCNLTNPLNYQVIILDRPITELEIYGLMKVYEDRLISRENNRNLHFDIIGEIIFSKGSYNIKDDYITIRGSNTTYICNASMYMEDIYKTEILKNANNLLIIKFDIKEVPKRTLLDKILCRNYHSHVVFYDEYDDSYY